MTFLPKTDTGVYAFGQDAIIVNLGKPQPGLSCPKDWIPRLTDLEEVFKRN